MVDYTNEEFVVISKILLGYIRGSGSREERFEELREELMKQLSLEKIVSMYPRFMIDFFEDDYYRDSKIDFDRDEALKLHSNLFYDLYEEAISTPEYSEDVDYYVYLNLTLVLFLCGLVGELTTATELKEFPIPPLVKIASNKEVILINGESGTGKELYAKAIHHLSPWKKNKYLSINVTCLPETLVESELFGHEKGAFSGAIKQKKGLFSIVGDGTLFLDEIGDLPLSIQVKLLRVLEYRDFFPIGGEFSEKQTFNGRIIVATNKNLQEEVKANKFREDLFHRLNVLTIGLPTLRERLEFLLQHGNEAKEHILYFLKHIIKKTGVDDTRGYTFQEVVLNKTGSIENNRIISNNALECLTNYNYPGNYRELMNILKRMYLLSEGKINYSDIPSDIRDYVNNKTNENILENIEGFANTERFENIKLEDIIKYTQKVQAQILKSKIEDIYVNGSNVKRTLLNEKYDVDYSSFTSKINILLKQGGESPIRAIKSRSKRLAD